VKLDSERNIEAVLEFLGRDGAYGVLRQLMTGPQRFSELQEATKLLPRTLSMRLKEMEKEGLVSRQRFAEVPPRVIYTLTPKGESLQILFDALDEWRRSG